MGVCMCEEEQDDSRNEKKGKREMLSFLLS